MKLWPLLLVLLAGCSGCASLPSHDDLRATALRIESDRTICAATAIGPHTFRTATHCLSYRITSVNYQPVTIIGAVDKGRDQADVTVSGITFKHWAKIGGPLHQGDHVRWWGQPLGSPFVYREGYVSLALTTVVVIDATICHGDSGSGIFNERGELAGVISAMNDANGCTFMVTYPLAGA